MLKRKTSRTLKRVAHSGAAVSRAPASTTLIYITLVFPIHADMVPYELLIELMKCWELMHASHTSQLDIHKKKKKYFSCSMLVTARDTQMAWETTAHRKAFTIITLCFL